MQKNKKQAAAIAGVMAYLRQEEEALAMQAMAQADAGPPAPAAPFQPWGVSGRQAQMQMRSLMELKAFHGWKMR